MEFSDSQHSAAELVIQGADQASLTDIGDSEIQSALERWTQRSDRSAAAPDEFSIEEVQYLAITYDGKTSDYVPSQSANWLSETLIRDVLFRDGICTLQDMAPRVYSVRYKSQAITGTEHLLVCPYPTSSGNIGGLVVVCINHHLRTD